MIKLVRYFFFISAYIISSLTVLAQDSRSSFAESLSVSAGVHYGFFVANQPKSQYLRDSHTILGEIAILSQTRGTREWQQQNNFPAFGMSFLFGNTGSREYIGSMAALIPFIDFPLLHSSRVKANFRLGFGPGWVEKPFDSETNYKNFMISTHLNACIHMSLKLEFPLVKKLYFQTGFSFTHLSNGSIQLPNLGLNIPALTTGLRYAFNESVKIVPVEQPAFKKQTHVYFFAFGAAKQTYPLKSPVYLVNIFNLELAKDYSATGRIGLGVNYAYDRSLSSEVANAPTYTFDKSKSHSQVGIIAFYEHKIGKLSIPLQFGVYVYNKYPISSFFQNIGIRYRFANRWTGALQLKTHMGKADYIQLGIGYKF